MQTSASLLVSSLTSHLSCPHNPLRRLVCISSQSQSHILISFHTLFSSGSLFCSHCVKLSLSCPNTIGWKTKVSNAMIRFFVGFFSNVSLVLPTQSALPLGLLFCSHCVNSLLLCPNTIGWKTKVCYSALIVLSRRRRVLTLLVGKPRFTAFIMQNFCKII